jgi:hypothetical protein
VDDECCECKTVATQIVPHSEHQSQSLACTDHKSLASYICYTHHQRRRTCPIAYNPIAGYRIHRDSEIHVCLYVLKYLLVGFVQRILSLS